jgi:hypothetical protein
MQEIVLSVFFWDQPCFRWAQFLCLCLEQGSKALCLLRDFQPFLRVVFFAYSPRQHP